ncbi:amino acid/polyamine transporter I [Stachybotrys elegans]|uniref:Amino acid/polyamine transporter I n=1 Tax=Stachybotrys elegans TaxID=80388 RepID=A0A8K0SFM3_9HYPO|nr:amino acid/polyamine transporter I [Stachybotrys elegans]
MESSGPRDADQALAALGYKRDLPRHLSMMSILGLSFAIMAVPFGLSTTLSFSLLNGQAVTVLWGWVLVSLISLSIAASLAEITSVFPTSGGVYYFSASLSGGSPLAAFVTGWLTLVGNWTVTLSINFSGAQLILSAITIFDDTFVPTQWQTILCFWAVMIVCAAVNAFGSKYLDLINKICVYWTAFSVLAIIITLLATADTYRSGEYVFAHYEVTSGWADGWAFFVGLLQAAYTLTGYGMVASMCEEVANPEREVPRAMVLSVVAAAITGLVYLIPLLFVLPDVAHLLSYTQPIGILFRDVTGSKAGGLCLLLLILGILFFAGVGALTASSRCCWAFSRDKALPGYKIWSRVNHRFEVPLWSLILSTVIDCLLGLIALGSASAFGSFTGCATICLSTSYVIPVFLNLIGGRKDVKNAPYSLGRLGFFINGLCSVWIVLAIVLFSMPVALPVDAGTTMNYASVVFVGFACLATGWYFAFARRNFTGPPRDPLIHGQEPHVDDDSLTKEK